MPVRVTRWIRVGLSARNVRARSCRHDGDVARLAFARARRVATDAIDAVATDAFITAYARCAVDLFRDARTEHAIIARCTLRVACTRALAHAHIAEIRDTRDLHCYCARSGPIAGRSGAERCGVGAHGQRASRTRCPLRALSRAIACARRSARRLHRCVAFVVRIEVVPNGAAHTVDTAAFFACRTRLAKTRARVVATDEIHAVAIGAFIA